MKKIFLTGELAIYDDLKYGEMMCVVLGDGVSGYGSDKRVIYIIYCFRLNGTYLAYGSELSELKMPDE